MINKKMQSVKSLQSGRREHGQAWQIGCNEYMLITLSLGFQAWVGIKQWKKTQKITSWRFFPISSDPGATSLPGVLKD
jgi:hypothetical protein